MRGVACSMEEALASQLSPLPADQVPSSDRHTFPQLYRFCDVAIKSHARPQSLAA